MQNRSEFFITQFAMATANNESLDISMVKAEIVQDVSRALARTAVRAIARRTKRPDLVCRDSRRREEVEQLEE